MVGVPSVGPCCARIASFRRPFLRAISSSAATSRGWAAARRACGGLPAFLGSCRFRRAWLQSVARGLVGGLRGLPSSLRALCGDEEEFHARFTVSLSMYSLPFFHVKLCISLNYTTKIYVLTKGRARNRAIDYRQTGIQRPP